MKKSLFAAVAALLLLNFIACGTSKEDPQSGLNTHNSQNSLDWAGVYTGTIPAADGEGINVGITLDNGDSYLNSTGSFTATYQYIGKSSDVYTYSGSFKWSDDGSTVILDTKEIPPYYKVGESFLIQLDMEGNVIVGEFAAMYVLEKRQ